MSGSLFSPSKRFRAYPAAISPAGGRRPGWVTGPAPKPKKLSSMPMNAASPPARAIRAAMSCSSRKE
jgi:hypothetical protein